MLHWHACKQNTSTHKIIKNRKQNITKRRSSKKYGETSIKLLVLAYESGLGMQVGRWSACPACIVAVRLLHCGEFLESQYAIYRMLEGDQKFKVTFIYIVNSRDAWIRWENQEKKKERKEGEERKGEKEKERYKGEAWILGYWLCKHASTFILTFVLTVVRAASQMYSSCICAWGPWRTWILKEKNATKQGPGKIKVTELIMLP